MRPELQGAVLRCAWLIARQSPFLVTDYVNNAKDCHNALCYSATDAGAVQADSRSKFDDAEPSGWLLEVFFHISRGVERFVPRA